MSKKFLISALLTCLVVGMVLPQIGLAQEELPKTCTMKRDTGLTDCPAKDAVCDYDDPTQKNCGICCLVSTVYYASDWMFTGAILVVLIFTLWGAFEILTSTGGSTEQYTTGRNRIQYAVMGLVIAILAKAIPGVVRFLLG